MAFFTLTKKSDYGLLLVAELARLGRGEVLSTQKLARERGLPKAFLASIGKDLVGAGIIKSKEGKNGGYYLDEDPKEIGLVKVIEAIEGKLRPVTCVIEHHNCPVEEVCIQKDFMVSLADEVSHLLSKYTVADLSKEGYKRTWH